ncbi:MAG: hypothetical protein IJO32_00320 [Bacilli bacterium]|nr:hypothetical protein [Bacilli bacterium]
MKKWKNKKLIIILSFFFVFALVSAFINNAFFKPTKLNAFITAKIYKSPSNISFKDDALYKCVIDAYNIQNNTEEPYTTSLSETQLSTIENLACSGTIYEVDGIETLTNLKKLDIILDTYRYYNIDISNKELQEINIIASDNLLLNLEQATKLTKLHVDVGEILGTLDLSNNIDLTDLKIDTSKYGTYTGDKLILNNNINLKSLDLNITSYSFGEVLDISSNTNLEKLKIHDGYMSEIIFSNYQDLKEIDFSLGDLATEVNLNKMPNLEKLKIHNNGSEILGFSELTKLKEINLNYNTYIDTLDLSNSSYLESANLIGNGFISVTLDSDSLETVNVSNNNNNNLSISSNKLNDVTISGSKLKTLVFNNNTIDTLNLSSTPLLNSITIDSSALKNINIQDSSEPLSSLTVSISGTEEMSLNGKVNELNLESPTLKNLNVSNLGLINLNIDNSTGLEILNVNNNNLDSLDLNNNSQIKNINLSNNSISELDISSNTELSELIANSNKISSIDLSNNTKLAVLELNDNLLNDIDFANNNRLISLKINENNLKTLDFKNCTYFESLSATNNSNLEYVNLENNKYVETIDLFSSLNCDGEQDEYNSCLSNNAFRGKVKLHPETNTISFSASSYKRTGVFSSVHPLIYSCPSRTYDFAYNFFENYNPLENTHTLDLSAGNVFRKYDGNIRYCETAFYIDGGLYRETNAVYFIELASNSSYFIDTDENFIDIYDEKISNNILDNLSLNYGEMRINNDKLQVLFDNEVIKEFDIRTTYVSPININNKVLSNTINNDNSWYKGYNGNFSFDIIANDENLDLNTLNVSVIKNNSDVSHIFNIDKEIVDDKLTINIYNISASCDIGDYYVNISDSNEVMDTILFTISEPTKVSNITTENIRTVNVDEIIDINYKILPENATNKQLELIIADESIAIIENGKIKGLKEGETTLTLKATDGSNIVKTITIKVIDFDIKTDKYNIDDNLVIKKIKDKLLFDNFINDFTVNSDINIKVFNNDVEIDYTKSLGTGHKLKTYSNDELLNEYTLIVSGDINGDGQSNAADIIFMKSHILGKSTLDGILFKAGDIDENNSVNATDIIYLKSYILGKTNNVWSS